jgi:hypothetical protein
LVGKPGRKSLLENLGVDGKNIVIDLREIKWEEGGVDREQ